MLAQRRPPGHGQRETIGTGPRSGSEEAAPEHNGGRCNMCGFDKLSEVDTQVRNEKKMCCSGSNSELGVHCVWNHRR